MIFSLIAPPVFAGDPFFCLWWLVVTLAAAGGSAAPEIRLLRGVWTVLRILRLGWTVDPDGTALLGPMVWPNRAGEPEHGEQRLPFEAAVTPDWRPPASENGDPFGE